MEETESTDQNSELDEQVISAEDKATAKKEKLERERVELLNRVNGGSIAKVRDRVAFILNYSNEARNSDIALAWLYWQTFEKEKFDGSTVTEEELKNLTKQGTLSRHRAKIQNEYKLFEADVAVKQYRRVLRNNNIQEAVEDKPKGLKTYSVYIDETGKNQKYISVGSLWILEITSLLAYKELDDWKHSKALKYEFHFSDLDRFRLPMFKEFFNKFLELHPAISFKLIVLNNKGFVDKNSVITDLTYHLLKKGVDHENTSGRAPLPRVLQVWIDEDEKGSDTLKIENIKERLASQKMEGLFLEEFQAIDSSSHLYIQIIDLFTGAINRKLHQTDARNHKDDFAEYVLDTLGFDIDAIDTENNDKDHSTVFNLR
ncbi:DUF3800 domain-containing protein [Pontibacter qinzhouensis]|uniref:DUF3800 domain-containing protein n=1 Tax=Pontibacter qinzhouensis TaxID=2603253 RepID=A0A5C8IZC4_9BACT|nr:DUF3800 domain-containing protein [Pontibacter qinzhouensis]TXK26549.1 DUF3800 domain-containing protein [Pontibacter qinzhouensis]